MAGLTLLDAYALVALLTGGPAAPEVRQLIREDAVASPAINLAEAADVLRRRFRVERTRVRAALASLTERPLAVIDLDERAALAAAELRAQHYHRANRPISIADCVLLAGAGAGDRVATADRHVLATAAAEGIETVELSRG